MRGRRNTGEEEDLNARGLLKVQMKQRGTRRTGRHTKLTENNSYVSITLFLCTF